MDVVLLTDYHYQRILNEAENYNKESIECNSIDYSFTPSEIFYIERQRKQAEYTHERLLKFFQRLEPEHYPNLVRVPLSSQDIAKALEDETFLDHINRKKNPYNLSTIVSILYSDNGLEEELHNQYMASYE